MKIRIIERAWVPVNGRFAVENCNPKEGLPDEWSPIAFFNDVSDAEHFYRIYASEPRVIAEKTIADGPAVESPDPSELSVA